MKAKNLVTIFIIVLVLIISGFFVARATVNPNPCPGNVCSGSVTVGGQEVKYYYTEHVRPNGQFRIRLNGGFYSTNTLVSYMVYNLPAFVSWGVETRVGAMFLPEENVNPSKTSYERRDSNGLTGNVDQVMWVNFDNAPEEAYGFSLSVTQYGTGGDKENLPLYIDANAPANANESEAFASIGSITPCADYPANDPFIGDNDVDFNADCQDSQCNGQIGNPADNNDICEYAAELNCLDRFDNDFDADGNVGWDYNRETGLDCRDPDCDAQMGDPDNPANKCRYNDEADDYPTSCSDNFNNDADNGRGAFESAASAYDLGNIEFYDCYDFDCWGRAGDAGGSCPIREQNCGDGDDDFDALWVGQSKIIRGNTYFFPDNGAVGNRGADCNDYDCAGDATCPAREDYDRDAGTNQSAACFDGIDNDLDNYSWNGNTYNQTPNGTVDCGDADCAGAINPDNPGEVCRPNEFTPWSYQLCWNELDEDGDDPNNSPPNQTPPAGVVGGTSCEDNRRDDGGAGDCWQAFGNCGPCPSVENIIWDACGDSRDNDLDGAINCADNDCRDSSYTEEVGDAARGALCSTAENSAELCSDGADNDGDGFYDCRDFDCDGLAGCQINESGASCVDGADNDGDGKIDCLDEDCQGGGECGSFNWNPVSCINVPSYDFSQPGTSIISTNPTVFIRQLKYIHINDSHEINISGTSTYNSLTIWVGSNSNPQDYYPFDAQSCILSGSGSTQMTYTANTSTLGKIINNAGEVINNFNITLTCNSIPTPQALDDYSIRIEMEKQDGSTESGQKTFSVTVFEDVAPNINQLEHSGAINNNDSFNVIYGRSLNFRGLPEDDTSGICDCQFNFDGDGETNIKNDCTDTYSNIIEDKSNFALGVRARDGADNVGAETSRIININVTPIQTVNLKLDKSLTEIGDDLGETPPAGLTEMSAPFYKQEQTLILKNATFQTSAGDSITACDLKINDQDVYDSGGAFWSFTPAGGNPANCAGEVKFSEMYEDAEGGSFIFNEGIHFAELVTQDSDGDIISSNKQAFYICNSAPLSYPAGHACRRADFDQDGAPDGVLARSFITSKCFDGAGAVLEPAQACDSDADCGDGNVCRQAAYCDGSTAGNRILCFSDADCQAQGAGSCGEPLVCDNCPAKWNPDQADDNANGLGNACDGAGVCSVFGGACQVDGDCPLNTCEAGSCKYSGEACVADSDCLENICLSPQGGGEGFCTISCSADGDCDSDGYNSGICVNNNYCAASDGARSCASDADCDSGVGEFCYDNCPDVENPEQTDTDNDGAGNACDEDDDNDGVDDGDDNCPLIANPGQEDTDGDGIGDACEDDSDGDGILDDGDGSGIPGDNLCADGQTENCDDNCLLVANPAQADANGNGRGDVCECDFDGDGVDDPGACGGADNCPLVANPTQDDSDGDGVGDACENDYDGDGVLDIFDNCPYTPNQNQNDWDGNSTGDVCDPLSPEGIYEPYSASVPRIAQKGLYQDTFDVILPNVTAPAETELLCRWHKLDAGNILTESLTLTDSVIFENVEVFQYQIQPEEPELGDPSLDPWKITSCEAAFPNMDVSPYVINVQKPIYTHGNYWTGFDNPYDDGNRAVSCYLGTSTTYYGATDVCSITGDIGSINFLSAGIGTEIFCYDGTDNDSKLGTDCGGIVDLDVPADPNCQGLSYACRCTKNDDCPSSASLCLNGNCIKP